MNTNDTFLAIFLANKTSPRMTAWNALSEEARHSQMQEGIAAWKAWVCRQAVREASALHDLSWRFRRGHAGSADTGRLAGGSNVCFWHKADMPVAATNVCFWG